MEAKMRLWHKDLIKYLPQNQLCSQWRECVLIAKDICEKGKTNHLLINRIMNYDIKHFNLYCQIVWEYMDERKIYTTLQSEQKMFKYLGIKFDYFCTGHYAKLVKANIPLEEILQNDNENNSTKNENVNQAVVVKRKLRNGWMFSYGKKCRTSIIFS